MISITKRPCILVSNQRSGSTALASILTNQYSTKLFIEPAEQRVHLSEFIEYYNDFTNNFESSNKNWLVKCMIDKIRTYKLYKKLLENPEVFKIRLYRKDTVAQAASLYLASLTGMWFGNQIVGINEEFMVPVNKIHLLNIDHNLMKRCVHKIIFNNRLLVTADNFRFDITLQYESLNLDTHNWRKSEVSSNYPNILGAAEHCLRANNYPLIFNI